MAEIPCGMNMQNKMQLQTPHHWNYLAEKGTIELAKPPRTKPTKIVKLDVTTKKKLLLMLLLSQSSKTTPLETHKRIIKYCSSCADEHWQLQTSLEFILKGFKKRNAKRIRRIWFQVVKSNSEWKSTYSILQRCIRNVALGKKTKQLSEENHLENDQWEVI